jgi:tartrate dehydratase alpha subunit/fumarate hydratase class I-like protein
VETRSSSVAKLSVDISGQDQVKITCVMTKTGSEGKSYFTTALGDAVLIA